MFVFVFVRASRGRTIADGMGHADRVGFENLEVWQLARQLCADISPVAATAAARHDYELSQQLNAAGLSIMSNIAEGYLRRAPKEFAYFVRIAAGSNGEVRASLYAAFDRGAFLTNQD